MYRLGQKGIGGLNKNFKKTESYNVFIDIYNYKIFWNFYFLKIILSK